MDASIRPLPVESVPLLRMADAQVNAAVAHRLALAKGVLAGMGIDVSDESSTAWGVDTDKCVAIGTPKEQPAPARLATPAKQE